ncbi:MAG TPA: cytochrome P450, partial [Chitinophaga sp.]|uniref:cytochrome P450 n=1 Tax=Chitinophaga sp. TaxID=1869181 RepID=UPI002BDE0824
SYMANDLLGSNINQTDPPLHTALRGIISGPFSKPALETMESFFYDICYEQFSEEHAEMDLAVDFAFPFVTAAICHLLGVPYEEKENIHKWAKAIVTAGYVQNGLQVAAAAQREMGALFSRLLYHHKTSRDNSNILSILANAELDGEPLSFPIQLGTAMTVLLAGYETTANLVINSVHILAESSDLQSLLRNTPGLLPTAIQEALRLRPSLVSMYRKAIMDTEIEGMQIKEGDVVNAWISTANRDPAVFETPSAFSLARKNSGMTLSFGYGIHHCIGAGLARQLTRIALEVLLQKTMSFSLVRGVKLQPSGSLISPGFDTLPLTLTVR